MSQPGGLGCIVGAFDRRNLNFPMAKAPGIREVGETRRWRYWYPNGWWGDQGSTNQCTAYAFTHWLKDGPVTQVEYEPNPYPLYKEFQKHDPWGERATDDGSTISAGAEVLHAMGFISSYYWSNDGDTILAAVLSVGPVVIGIPWYTGMFYPDENGIIHVTGRIEGYHAIPVNGINLDADKVRLKNSWGKFFGRGGHCYLSVADFRKLVSDRWAEAMLAIEVRPQVGVAR